MDQLWTEKRAQENHPKSFEKILELKDKPKR